MTNKKILKYKNNNFIIYIYKIYKNEKRKLDEVKEDYSSYLKQLMRNIYG